MSNRRAFGYHLLLDLYDCREGACDDLDLCYKFLDEVVEFIEMKKQSPPYIFRTDEQKYPDKAGLSGWVPLVESGVQIHTLSRKNFISVDIYSCREFSIERVKEFVKNYFQPKEIEEKFVLRGTKYYQF